MFQPQKSHQIVICIVALYTKHYNHILQFYIEKTVTYFFGRFGLGMRLGNMQLKISVMDKEI